MAQYLFGAGTVVASANSDAYGNTIATPTPVEMGVLQSVSVDFGFDLKTLFGRGQFAVDAARGKGSIKGKASAARVNGALLNNLIFGQTVVGGSITAMPQSVSGSVIPSAGGNTILIAPPNTGTFKTDLGVTDAKAVPLKRVTAAPTTGQYSVDESTGTYTFATADAGKTVFINYRYSATVAGAQGGTIMNLDMGNAPTFALDVMQAYKGKILHFKFHRCMSNKLGMATKQDDYNIPDFEFEAFADDTGRVFDWYISE